MWRACIKVAAWKALESGLGGFFGLGLKRMTGPRTTSVSGMVVCLTMSCALSAYRAEIAGTTKHVHQLSHANTALTINQVNIFFQVLFHFFFFFDTLIRLIFLSDNENNYFSGWPYRYSGYNMNRNKVVIQLLPYTVYLQDQRIPSINNWLVFVLIVVIIHIGLYPVTLHLVVAACGFVFESKP